MFGIFLDFRPANRAIAQTGQAVFTDQRQLHLPVNLAGMMPKTATKYIQSGELPSDQKTGRDWATREDPFTAVWAEVATRLAEAPELQAKALFEWLCEQYPGQFQEGQLRTFQREVKRWRATNGPAKEVYFPQVHEPGKRLSFDFSQWDKIFEDAMTTAAAIDRLVHHSTIFELTNESYRMKAANKKY